MSKVVDGVKHILSRTVVPAAAVTRARFAGADGEQIASAGARNYGVYIDTLDATDVADGESVGIVMLGLVDLEVDAGSVDIAVGDKLASTATGKGKVATAGQAVGAIALQAATADGDHILAFVFSDAIAPAASTNVPDLTDNSGGGANDTLEACGVAVTGVDGVGSNAASKADVDTRLTAIANNVADLGAKINAILAILTEQGLMA